ncbi:hypothetical protein HU200_002115 [Digitaria exilis]|uniref:Uncharacterized protein n=1 Tax=Digitaria exilis TaxID=1010633 RepID=A0A835G001_9POAL|nr:hypothetical protein HU200_002115 [Digitaria exilis]
MDDFPLISDHSLLLQGHAMFGAEGRLGILSPSGVLSSEGKTVPTQDGRKNKGKELFSCDWPELLDFEPSLRNFDSSFEIGSKYFDDTLWSSLFSPEVQHVPSSYFDDIDFSIDQNESIVLKTNPTKTKQQTRNGASDTPLYCDAHASSSSGLPDAELFRHLDDIELANQIGGCDGLEAIFSSSQETRTPTPSSSMCSGPVSVATHIPPPSEKPHDPFRGAPDMVLEEMAKNPLDMYFPPLPMYEQPEMLMSMSDTTSAAQFPGSYALNCAESQFCSKEMAPAGGLHGQPGSAVVLEAVPVKDLGFQKLQEGVNQLDLATRARIRESLYRLANRVEQRHCAAASSGAGSSVSKRFRSGGWTEAQTNPMDQSVAQLLLQKASYRKTVRPHRVT